MMLPGVIGINHKKQTGRGYIQSVIHWLSGILQQDYADCITNLVSGVTV